MTRAETKGYRLDETEVRLALAQSAPARSRSILVVDDEALVRRSITRGLERANYHVYGAQNVAEALAIAEEHRIDAAIVDYSLARESGLTVLSKLRHLQPHCVRILCTGRTELPIFVEAVNTGEVAKVLQKPFDLAKLLSQLEVALASQAQLERYTTEQHHANHTAERQCLEQAMKADQLGMAIQPIVSWSGGEAVPRFFEALLRPRHRELSNPLALLAAAERQGRTIDVATTVLHEALRCLSRVPEGCGLFVNLHPEQLGHPDELIRALEGHQAHASRITLEITERSRLQDIARWDESVRMLNELGFAIAVDDLGAGYSSLSILADLHPQFIKLDMSLVRGVHLEPRKQRLVQLMCTFGVATEAQVIAEGVEELDEAKALVDCGIQLMQGYYFGRPG